HTMAAMARAATTSDAFNAIAEPQRREILVLLRGGERPVTGLARDLGMSQPQASKHLRVLREVGLVRVRGAGKQRLYDLDARGLRPVHEWLGGFERFWSGSFDRLDEYVQDLKQAKWEEPPDGDDQERRRARTRDRGPRDRDVPGHQRTTGAGVRSVHAGPAPVAVVGTGGVLHHHAVLRVPRRRGLGLRDARAGRNRLPGMDHLAGDRSAGADRPAARRAPRRPPRPRVGPRLPPRPRRAPT